MLLSITAIAVICAGFAATAFAQNNSQTSTDLTTKPEAISSNTTIPEDAPFLGMGMIMNDQGFGGGIRCGVRGHGGRGPGLSENMVNIEFSAEFNETINAILNNDADVKNLFSQGYNVTLIRPEVKSVIGADGTITNKATAALVTLRNGTSGFVTVNVDIANAKVSQIVIYTRTVIDKSTS